MSVRSIAAMRSLRLLGGIAGIGGGGLAVLAIAIQQVLPGYVGLSLLAICEFVLVVLLARINGPAAGCAGLLLVVGLFLVGLLVWTRDLFVGPGYAAIGIVIWALVAPAIAVLLARAGRLAMAPAIGLAVITLVVIVLSGSGIRSSDPAPVVVGIAYFLAWAWLGYAMLRGASREPPSSDARATPGPAG